MERILLCLAHMSGREMDFIKEAFADNWVAPLGSIPGNVLQVGVAGIIVLAFIEYLRKYIKEI